MEEVGGWVTDTIGGCRIFRTTLDPAACRFTPLEGGSYQVSFTARDSKGREARTTVYRGLRAAAQCPGATTTSCASI
jgi:hypothetical protein